MEDAIFLKNIVTQWTETEFVSNTDYKSNELVISLYITL